MTDSSQEAVFVDAMATLSAGYCGIFPEVELICWLRSSVGRAKLLAVQAVRPSDAYCLGSSPRSFEIAELELPEEQAGVLTSSLVGLGFPNRAPRIRGSDAPESIWWAHLRLAVSINGTLSSVDVGLGPEGLRGEDAQALRTLFHVLLDAAGCQDRLALDLLTSPQPDF